MYKCNQKASTNTLKFYTDEVVMQSAVYELTELLTF